MMRPLILQSLCIVAACAAVACSKDPGTSSDPCGQGTAIEHSEQTYCLYTSELIIEGFECPQAAPHRFDVGSNDVLCSPEPHLSEAELDDIAGPWLLEENNRPASNNRPSSNNGEPDAGGPDDTGPFLDIGLLPEFCEGFIYGQGDLEPAVGDPIIVIDWQCPVSACCGDGTLIASCPNMGGDYVCKVDNDGWYNCTAWDDLSMTACPSVAGAVGETCAYHYDDDACATGAYCDAPNLDQQVGFGNDQRGVCTALPALCNADACYSDDDCSGAIAGTRCYGASARDGVVGICRAPAGAPPACLDASDCPFDWTCETASLACDDACACPDLAAADTPGVCEKTSGASNPSIWLRNGDDLTWSSTVEAYIAKGDIGTASNWVSCPAYELQQLDPQLGWQSVAEEPCSAAESGQLREVLPGQLLPLNGIQLSPQSPDTNTVRLRAEYYAECGASQTPTGCQGGPFEFFTPATYEVAP